MSGKALVSKIGKDHCYSLTRIQASQCLKLGKIFEQLTKAHIKMSKST